MSRKLHVVWSVLAFFALSGCFLLRGQNWRRPSSSTYEKKVDLTFDTPRHGRVESPPNSATGTPFGNHIIRSFSGKRLTSFPQEHPQIDLAEKSNGIESCKQWGVVTTIFNPTRAVARVAKIPSWCLVIVPDLKTPVGYITKLKYLLNQTNNTAQHFSMSRIFYLSKEVQQKWQNVAGPFGAFVQSLQWNHFCRKNLGYLFAITHGAEFIFDFDDDNFIRLDKNGSPLKLLPKGKGGSTMKLPNVAVVMQGASVFNHHPIMGATVGGSWARGFPISSINDDTTRGEVAFNLEVDFVARDREIGVIQILADGDPDVDAIHRMTKPLPMSFESNASVMVPVHSYSPYNAQATIHTKNAFWALLLPGTVHGRVSDIWRAYFAQCIFADVGLRLVFSPPAVSQDRNDHDYLADFNAEQDLYERAGPLIEYLREWDCHMCDTVPKRMEALWINLYERGYIEIDDVYAVQMWLEVLAQVGYNFPPLKRRFRNVAVMGQFNYADRISTVKDVIFWAQKWREHFHTVVAAGPFSENQMKLLEKNSITASLSNSDAGYISPLKNTMDMLLAYKNSTRIEAVLYVHDDGIINITELSRRRYPFPTSDIMNTATTHERHGGIYRAFPDGHTETANKSTVFESFDAMFEWYVKSYGMWNHFNTGYCGRGQMKLAADSASDTYRESDGSILYPFFEQSDFAYIPTKYTDEFAKAADLHMKHGIFIECAFPKIWDMLLKKTDAKIREVELCTSWGGDRNSKEMVDRCEMSSDSPMGFIHPFKISTGYREFSEVFDRVQTAMPKWPKCNPLQVMAECTSSAKNLGNLRYPEECAREMTNTPECGDTFMFSVSYPVWGCRCCIPGDQVLSGNENWALYSARESASDAGVLTCL
ncbi:hypothetical protein ACHAWF_014761 [Thalassiosira exigua]